MITLITMGQGNATALKRTLDSFKGVVNEIIFGDVLIFEDDRKTIAGYAQQYNIQLIPLPFNYIFLNGFAATLNHLAEYATNDLILYMNVSEIIDETNGRPDILGGINDAYNCYLFDHATDKHKWTRLYDKRSLRWDGMIHEEIVGPRRQAPKIIFRMADTEKDMDNPFKVSVFNDIKEITYFEQYRKLVEEPEKIGVTNVFWVDESRVASPPMRTRLESKGDRYKAFQTGDFELFLKAIHDNPEWDHTSSTLINYQGKRKDIL